MSSRRNKTPLLNNPVNLDEEINVKDFPYYQYIPIKSISNKQKKIVEKYKTKQKDEPIIIPKTTIDIETQDTIAAPPVKYTAQIEEMEKQLSDINQEIQENLEKLYQQQQTISTNEQYIQEQFQTIDTNKKTIDTNNEYINQQVVSYNHNLSVLTSQCNQANGLNADIQNLSQIINGLNSQIVTAQSELQTLNLQLDDAKTQLNYHGNMLNAFNIVTQNPQYFMQMMAAASGVSFEQNEYNDPYYST